MSAYWTTISISNLVNEALGNKKEKKKKTFASSSMGATYTHLSSKYIQIIVFEAYWQDHQICMFRTDKRNRIWEDKSIFHFIDWNNISLLLNHHVILFFFMRCFICTYVVNLLRLLFFLNHSCSNLPFLNSVTFSGILVLNIKKF